MRVLVTYGFNTNLEGCCSIVDGKSYVQCMDKIRSVTNMNYSFTYTTDIDERIKQFKMKIVPLQPMYSKS